MSFSNSSIRTAVSAMPTIQITGTIVSFAKKVCCISFLTHTRQPLFLVVWVGSLVVKELKRIIESSEITKWVSSLFALFNSLILLREDDTNWPKKNIVGKQELEIRIGNDHISFEVRFNLDISLYIQFPIV